MLTIVSELTREEAIKHLIETAEHWISGNKSDMNSTIPLHLSHKDAFALAVEHVNYHHYNLSKKDIKEAKNIFFKINKITKTELHIIPEEEIHELDRIISNIFLGNYIYFTSEIIDNKKILYTIKLSDNKNIIEK